MSRTKEKKALLPELRFPEFEGEWSETSLKSISTRIRKKVGDKQLTPVSITAGVGFVDQTKKFGRRIAGAQYKNYIHIRRGDFVYNKGNSKTFAQGCIYQLNEFDEAAASTAFICFKLDGDCVDHYFQNLFECNTHGKQLIKFITSGARSDGLLNINQDDFFSIQLPVPPTKPEQQKIADCLGSLDELIAARSAKLAALQDHKKGLLQQLFPAPGQTTPKLRFPGFAGEWQTYELGDLCSITTGRLDANAMIEGGKYRFYTCAKSHYFIDEYAFDTEALLISGNGANVGYIHRYSGKFNAYQRTYVLDQFSQDIVFLEHFLNRNLAQRIELEKKDGNTPYIVKSTLSEMAILCPKPAEQQKIADCLNSLDALITAETDQIAALKQHRKGLMQKLFPNPERSKA